MKAYVSLHTAAPHSQIDHEVSYAGYARVPVEFRDDFGSTPLEITFPVIEADSDDVMSYIAIGAAEKGQGEIFMRIPALPMALKSHPERLTRDFWLQSGVPAEEVEQMIEQHGFIAPRVVICNTAPVPLPENLNPIARVARRLVDSGLMTAADLHPKLYEAINDALHNAGVPVIPVVRSAAANIDAKLDQLPSLRDWNVSNPH